MNTREIHTAFGGKLVGSSKMKKLVIETLVLLPENIQQYISQYCWFLGSVQDAWAYTFTGNDLADQHLIFLSDDLLRQNKQQIMWSVAHEIGHVVLKHRNSIFIKQSKQEITQQEIEADQFAAEYV